ncbi:hypothetical protein KC19_7G129100 [Ceratodon purpureus]|uniref:Uncharacterized protein n=1 Tax=Ceratodon purpureus TaxID=3225 RepID=A0A8T0H601_CERPU|nr:hypothetical protein KC19_7G129100 [Ceratodon purpureus]
MYSRSRYRKGEKASIPPEILQKYFTESSKHYHEPQATGKSSSARIMRHGTRQKNSRNKLQKLTELTRHQSPQTVNGA